MSYQHFLNFNVCPRVLEHGWPRHASLPGVVQLKSCFVQDCPYFLHLQTPYIHFLSHSWLSLFALRLLSTGQLKLARKIERLKHPRAHHDLPAPSPVDHSPAGIASRSPLTLPDCKVILVSDVCALEAACQRARQGGVIGSLEFAKIRVHFGPLSMCFSWSFSLDTCFHVLRVWKCIWFRTTKWLTPFFYPKW